MHLVPRVLVHEPRLAPPRRVSPRGGPPRAGVFGAMATLLLLGGCGGGDGPTGPADPPAPPPPPPPPAAPAAVQISGAPSSLVAGDTIQLSATVRDAAGTPIPGASVSWTSLTPEHLQPVAPGRFVALSGGEGRVRAAAGAVADTLSLEAEARRLTTLTASVSGGIFLTGDEESATVVARDQRQRLLTDAPLAWTSSHPERLQVDGDGALRALAPGEVTVSVTGAENAGAGPAASLSLRVVRGDGPRVPVLARLDSIIVAWMADNDVPGTQFSLMREGRLVFARSYGVRDSDRSDRVELHHLFRIGSVSKPVAGFAFLQLVDQGAVSLDDRIFEALAEEYAVLPGESVDPRLLQATARDVLRHQTGYADRAVDNRVFQGVWQFGARDALEHFRYGLGFPLTDSPGERYVYTNFNTQAVARYIERRTGTPFEDHVREVLLAPAGITRMAFGKGHIDERHPDEVRYHDAQGQGSTQIDQNNNAMVYYEASGSWIGNASDLMRLMRRVEGLDGAPGLVSPESLAEISTVNPAVSGGATSFYGLHLMVSQGAEGTRWSHSGAASGSWAFLMRRGDGITFAILANRESGGGQLSFNIHEALGTFAWPEHDLFDQVP